MDRVWWNLPGPTAFLEHILDGVRTGNNIVIGVPEYSPAGLFSAVRARMDDGERLSLEMLDISSEKNPDPVGILLSRFVGDRTRRSTVSCDDLCREELFMGKTVWLEGFQAETWPVWREFLQEYAQVSKLSGILQRTKICALLKGNLALCPPNEDVCLENWFWEGRVSWLDMFLYSSILFQSRALPSLIRNVVICISSKLAAWDPAVVDAFAAEDNIENVFSPHEVLRRIARSREWTDASRSEAPCWHKGLIDTVDGDVQVHSAYISCLGKDRITRGRVWSAQVGVVLPFVEERRMELVEALTPFLEVPFTTRFGETVMDVRDLEIGHIEQQLINSEVQLDWELLRFIGKLRDIRNVLAHGEPIDLSTLTSGELTNYKNILEPFATVRKS